MESRTWKSPITPSNARRIWQPRAMQLPIGQWNMDIVMRVLKCAVQWIAGIDFSSFRSLEELCRISRQGGWMDG